MTSPSKEKRARKRREKELQRIRTQVSELIPQLSSPFRLVSCVFGGNGTLELRIQHEGYGGVTFAQLVEVSELFGTEDINVESEYEEGCPTCGGETNYYLDVLNVDTQKLLLEPEPE